MAIDSTAELLFNITANSDDAEENITRFRALMGDGLTGLMADFDNWAEEVLGSIETVQGAMIAMTAVAGAGLVALGGVLLEAGNKYQEYANEIAKAQRLTGMAAEDLSGLHSVAVATGTDFGTLTNGMVKFEQSIVATSNGSKKQQDAFAALGISQAEVIAGQKDMTPLLMKVMDGFQNTASAVQKASLAKDLFTRSGPELLAFLSKGSQYLKEHTEEAKKLGLQLTNENVAAAKAFTAAQRELNEQLESTWITIGKQTEGLRTWFKTMEVTLLKFFASSEANSSWNWIKELKDDYASTVAGIKQATQAASEIKPPVIIPPDQAGTVAKVKQDFYGISSVLESMKTKIASNGSEWDKVLEEVSRYNTEIAKSKDELTKLELAGKITFESFSREVQALAQTPAMLTRIMDEARDKIIEKQLEAGEAWDAVEAQIHGQLLDKLATYEGQSYQQKVAAWAKEMDAYRQSLQAKGPLTAENLALLDDINKAGLAKIARTQLDAQTQMAQQLAEKLATYNSQTDASQEAKFAKEMDSLRRQAAAKGEVTDQEYKLLDQIEQAGYDKIHQTQMLAFQKELVSLEGQLSKIVLAHIGGDEKLNIQYQADLEKYSEVEEKKALATAHGEAERQTIEAFYAQLRAALLQKHQQDLNALHNSEGWNNVFGAGFASMIKGNAQLYQQWASSANQSLLMVQVALEGLKEMSEKAFGSLVQGMAQSVVQAFATEKSIGQAMRQALASVLESFASQALVAAIMATAWGFYDLAMGDPAAAASAFTSAAIFGTVGGAAAVLGREVAVPAAATASGSAASSSTAGTTATSSTAAGAAATPQPTVNVYVQGHVIGPSGVAQLADIISQAVYNNDVTMYASHNAQGVPLQG